MKLLVKYGNPYTHDDLFLGIYASLEDALVHKQVYLDQFPNHRKVVNIIDVNGECKNDEVYLKIHYLEFLGQVYMKPICICDEVTEETNEEIVYRKMKIGQLYFENDFFI